MHALLILDGRSRNLRVMVKLDEKTAQNRVSALLGQNRKREALDVIKKRAQVQACFSQGDKIPFMPDLTFVEDLL